MTISINAKKSLAALVLVAPLALAACGSEAASTDESTSSASSTVTSIRTTESTTSEETSTSEVTETSESTEAAEPTEPTGVDGAAGADPAAEQQPVQVDGQFAEGAPTYAEAAPVEAGSPASDSERAEIEGLVQGIYTTNTIHEFIRYVPENSCSTVIEANGGPAALDLSRIPDMPLSQYPQYAASQPYVEAIEEVQIDGDQASAVVTAVASGQSETRTQRFQREDGRWTFCN